MRTIEDYKGWVLPELLKNDDWNLYVEALLTEIVRLQKYNMGSYNAVGFNGVEEDIRFSNENTWIICKSFDTHSGNYQLITNGWSLVSDTAVFVGGIATDAFLVTNYAFVLDRKYKVKFTLDNLNVTGTTTIFFGIGEEDQTSVEIDIGTADGLEVEVELTAKDYWLYFGVKSGANDADFTVKDLEVTGVEDVGDDNERWLVLNRILNVDNASRFILERMRDSRSFPAVGNMPEELLRQMVKDFNTFISYGGTQLSSIMFFYFLGYAADFVHLYAHTGDYEAETFSYLQQKDDDLLESTEPDEVYGKVDQTASSTYSIQLKEGHQVIQGDELSDQTNPFPQGMVRVTRVDGLTVYLEEAVTVQEDDLIDIYREYPYAVNPDPDNYFKTSHIDVFFKEKYLEGVSVSFNALEEFFTRYLPVNVVIRFFGYSDEIDDEEFRILEPAVAFKFGHNEVLDIDEDTVMPVEAYAHVVHSDSPENTTDVYGNPVDGSSYVIIGYADPPANTDPIYVVVPVP